MTGRLRITGGTWARRLIRVPVAAERGALRPTSDKVREALFASLQQRMGLEARVVADVFCGSGALGFEALSRGAASCVFVDIDPRTMRVVQENARTLGVEERCAFIVDDAVRFLRAQKERFDLILCDPPYALVLEREVQVGLFGALRDEGVVVLERAARGPVMGATKTSRAGHETPSALSSTAAARGVRARPESSGPRPPAAAIGARSQLAPAAASQRDDGVVGSAWDAAGLLVVDERRYGDTRLVIAQRATSPARTSTQPLETDMRTTPRTNAAVYPGSFDPLTNGHVDIVERGLRMFDRLVLAVANNPQKNHFFTAQERIALARESLGERPGLEIEAFDGLVVDFAQRKGVHVLLRGVRAVSDFEYEFQLAGMNRKLSGVETVFMATSEESFYVASRLVREVASFGGDVSSMVPAPVLAALTERYRRKAQ